MPITGRPKGSKNSYLRKGVANGLSNTRLYETWRNMCIRCQRNENYVGKGISVCEEWQDFLIFYDWAIANGYTDNLTIERKDYNGNYCPENCTWIPFKEQANNKSTTRLITIGDKTQNIKQWANEYGLCDETIRKRIKLGWSGEDLIKPVKR